MTDILQRSVVTGAAFDAEIDAMISLAPRITAQSLGTAIRLTLDRHHRYDRWFTIALQTAAALPEPTRSEACARLELAAGPPKPSWLVYLGAVQWLRGRKIDVSGLYPADRGAIADWLRATATPAATVAPITLRLAAE
jgi:hypothetical protein